MKLKFLLFLVLLFLNPVNPLLLAKKNVSSIATYQIPPVEKKRKIKKRKYSKKHLNLKSKKRIKEANAYRIEFIFMIIGALLLIGLGIGLLILINTLASIITGILIFILAGIFLYITISLLSNPYI